ncbi:MAG TPA: hypothetical protein DCR39_08780 [Nitrospiraceae bacterium]|nr:hypothetical protein [Nitrospiraceae bacterium]
MQKVISLFFIMALLSLMIVYQTSNLPASENDYDPVTGQPNCINCHTGDKKPSIDYTSDASCLQCHSAGHNERFISIDSRYEKKTIDHHMDITSIEGRNNPTFSNPHTSPLNKESLREVLENKVSSAVNSNDMVYVPEGEFTMGSDDWWPKCQPEHKRSLKGFYIDKYEVTNKRYNRFVEATRRKPPDHWVKGEIPKDRADHPVVFVTWNDANDFCQWEGKRLPTEPEWEKAARGTDKRTFPWGDKFDARKGNMPQLGKEDTTPVGSFENGKSPYGVYDLAGNVWEWTDDWFKPYPGNKHPDENYGEKYRVLRGGSWYDCTYYKCGISAPTYNRIFFNPNTNNNNFGFRCAKDAKDEVTKKNTK